MSITIVLDTETTGLGHDARVVELGAVAYSSRGTEIGAFGSLVKPTMYANSWRHAFKVSGIKRYDLDTAPEPEVVWDAFCAWLVLYTPVESIRAYNVAFDKRLLEATFSRAHHMEWGECLMRIAGKHIANKPKITLALACEKMNVHLGPQTHRALDDARRAAAVWYAIQAEQESAYP